MLDELERIYPYRVLLGALFFVTLGIHDRIKHPENPRRAKEYLFLAFAMVVAVAYGVVHDQITATISPEYFIYGKAIAFDPPPFRIAVALLAAKASYGVGLLAGAFLLIANNPSPRRLQLPYRELGRLAILPVGTAVVAAAVLGTVYGFDLFGLGDAARDLVPRAAVQRFLVVWGIHTGSYVGGGLGTLAAVILVRRRRVLVRGPTTADAVHLAAEDAV